MGKGTGLAIAGIALVAFIFIAYVIVPSVTMPNSMNLQWSVYGLKNNQRVTPPLAFIAQGVEIDSIGAQCSWVASGDQVDWDTLIIDGEFLIFLVGYSGTETDITADNLGFIRTGVSNKEGTTSFSLSLDSLIYGRPFSGYDGDLPYWDLKIELHVKGTIRQSVGDDVISDRIDDFVSYRIAWADGTFSLTGEIT